MDEAANVLNLMLQLMPRGKFDFSNVSEWPEYMSIFEHL